MSGSLSPESVVREFWRLMARNDELHLAVSPVLLGSGEHLLNGIDLPALGYECVESVPGVRATAHVTLRKARVR